MQLAFAIGLLGIYVGWRGTIARMTGFYDLSGAAKSLLFGIVSGVLAASAIDALILAEVRNQSQNIISLSSIAFMIALAESSFVLFLLGKTRTVGIEGLRPLWMDPRFGFRCNALSPPQRTSIRSSSLGRYRIQCSKHRSSVFTDNYYLHCACIHRFLARV